MSDSAASSCPPDEPRAAAAVVIDAQVLIREALCLRLSEVPMLEVVLAVGSVSAEGVADARGADLVLLHLEGDEVSLGREIQAVRAVFPAARLLVIASPRIGWLAERLMRSGVDGFLLTSSDFEELSVAVAVLLRGEPYRSPALADGEWAEVPAGGDAEGSAAGANPATALSVRELEIFCLVGSGRTTRQIAEALFISRKTVEAHKENIKGKLGLESAAELARTAALWVAQSHSRRAIA